MGLKTNFSNIITGLQSSQEQTLNMDTQSFYHEDHYPQVALAGSLEQRI